MIINANALQIPLASQSVHTVITSPPYWNLRDYGTAKWDGGDPDCDHEPDKSSLTSTLGGGKATQGSAKFYRDVCHKCGARRVDNQIGLEDTPDEYVAKMLRVFREVWRVMRDDATLWMNLGDTYSGSGNYRGINSLDTLSEKQRSNRGAQGTSNLLGGIKVPNGLKVKDLCGIPWRVAFALQGFALITIKDISALCKAIDRQDYPALQAFRAGFRLWEEFSDMFPFWIRSDVIWHKPNPMPESVTDRPITSHEHVFLLAKSKEYYYDHEAIKEPIKAESYQRWKGKISYSEQKRGRAGIYPQENAVNTIHKIKSGDILDPNGRNKRDVWTVVTHSYRGAHFATFPPKLIEPCILAGTSEKGVCPVCGKQWIRVMEEGGLVPDFPGAEKTTVGEKYSSDNQSGWSDDNFKPHHHREKIFRGFIADCEHNAEPVPAIVFDPFLGSGTSGEVARKFNRRFVGLDLSMEYINLAKKRTSNIQPMFSFTDGVIEMEDYEE